MRSSPRSIPICTRRCSAPRRGRSRSRSSFPRSTLPTFAKALEIARASAEFRETGAGDALRYRARFWSSDAATLRDLFEIVGGSDATEVLIDDRPVPVRARVVAAAGLVSDPTVTVGADPSSVERELTRLEAELKRLEAEYNMFFAGRLPKPPWETRARVEAIVKQYDRAHIPNTGDRFRFTTLQSRYATFIDLWDRGLRAREEGRPGPFAQHARPPRRPRKGPEDRILHVASFRDPVREIDKLTELYESLAEARREVGEDARAVSQVRRPREDAGQEAAGVGQRPRWRSVWR